MLAPFAAAVDVVLATGTTLHAWASATVEHRAMRGRGTSYAVLLGGTPVVVRHSRHGGLLAPLTRDLFVAPTRAPYELHAAIRLRTSGVPTPEIVAYATYTVMPGVRRADVVTREVAGHPLRTVAEAGPLLAAMSRAGAVHPDLNARNILVGTETYVLDVDRVYFLPPDDPRVIARNRARLLRSARKLGL